MKIKFLPIVLLFVINLSAHAQQTVLGNIQHDNIDRDYRLYIPSGYSSDTPLPLVFNLHGFTSDAFQQELYSEMNNVAEENNFLVCYPNGVDNAWNVDWNFGSTANDVDFISTLIDELASIYSINPNRVYSCGMSNGGFMSYRLACELNDRIAAIASVTGSMTPGYLCEPGKAVPVLEIHGTSDATVPYNGAPNLSTNIDDVVEFWATNNDCETNPDTTEIDNIEPLDLSTAIRIDYNECNNSKVSLFKVDNGGHTWPGATFIIGTTNQDFNASLEIWKFFAQYDLNGFTSTDEPLADPSAILVSPNPTADIVTLHGAFVFQQTPFVLYNQVGQKVQAGQINGATPQIDLSSLHAGLYYLTVYQDGFPSTQMVLKK